MGIILVCAVILRCSLCVLVPDPVTQQTGSSGICVCLSVGTRLQKVSKKEASSGGADDLVEQFFIPLGAVRFNVLKDCYQRTVN